MSILLGFQCFQFHFSYTFVLKRIFLLLFSGSQNNLCNGIAPGSGHNFVRKVHNHSPNAQKKNLVIETMKNDFQALTMYTSVF